MSKHVAVDTRHKRCLIKCIYTGGFTDSYLISDFGLVSWQGPRGEEVLALLRCYTALVRSCIPKFRNSLLVPSSTIQQSRNAGNGLPTTLRNIAEDLRHQLNCSGSLESRGKIYALIRSQMKEIIQPIKNICEAR